MADRVCFDAGTGSGGVVNVGLADPCFGADCGTGRASAVIDFSSFGEGADSAAVASSSAAEASRG
jgi:hypothetical protein